MRLPHLPVLAGLAALALAPSAAAADPAIIPVPVVTEGDFVPGIGAVTRIDNLVVNAHGEFLVEVDTDYFDTEADGVILRNGPGFVMFREGQLMLAPTNAALGSFDSVTLNDNGNASFNFFLENTIGGTSDDSGVYLNDQLLLQEGTVSNNPAYSGPTPYIGFFETKINDADQVLVMASIDDPGIASTVDRAIVLLDPVAGEIVLFKEGDPAALTGEFFTDFGTGPHELAFSNAGDVLFAGDLTGPTAANAAIFLNGLPIAREATASPVPGRLWSNLTSPELSLSSNGLHHAYTGTLDGDADSNLLLVVDGQKFVQEGDTLPDIAPFTITSFGSGPIHVTDHGDVIWWGDWNDPDTTRDTGLFFNHRLIVQENVTTTSLGRLITNVPGVQDTSSVSDDGRYILFEAVLDGTDEAVLRIDRGPWQILGGGFAGAFGEPKLRMTGSLAASAPISLEISGGAPSATGLLVVGLGTLNVPFLGATLVPAPDFVVALPLNASGNLFLSAFTPPGPSGVKIWLQFLVDDPSAALGLSATNAVVGTLP